MDTIISFDHDAPGAFPAGWRAGVTGRVGAGLIGVWPKPDSVTLFDDFSYGGVAR